MALQFYDSLLMYPFSSIKLWSLSKILPATLLPFIWAEGEIWNNRHRYKYLYGEEASDS